MKIRNYQKAAVARAYAVGPKSLFIVSPAGSGKTLMMSRLAKKFRDAGLRVCILTHRVKILQHIVRQVTGDVQEKVSVVGGGARAMPGPMTIACTGSVSRLDPKSFDVLLVDEAHRALAAQTHEFAKHFHTDKKKRLVGFSATPWRLDGKPMSTLFDELYVAATYKDLIRRRLILDPVVYTANPEHIPLLVAKTLHGGKSRKADFTGAELHALIRKSGLAGDLVLSVGKHLGSRQAVGFGVSIEHCIDMTSRVNENADLAKRGINAAFVHSGMAKRAQSTVIRDFEKGLYRLLFNVDILSEGWDMPTLGAVIMARPTLSLSLFIQQALRASRVIQGKEEPLLLDMACNSILHGHPSWDFEWSLEETDIITDLGGETARTPVVCKACSRVNLPGSTVCAGCGESLTRASGNRVLIPSELLELELRRTKQEDLAKGRAFARSHNFSKEKEDVFMQKFEMALTAPVR